MNRPDLPARIGPWLDGAWRHPARDSGGTLLPVVCPATGEELAQLAEDSPAAVDQAVRQARASFAAGTWSRASVAARKAVLLKVRDLILARADELAALECLNVGIPLRQARERHVARAALNFEFFAEFASQAADPVFHQHPDFISFVRREPAGVAALLAPWNAPLALATMKLAGALAFGNSVVLKPSELTPLPFLPLLKILKAAGVPDGVVSLVNGRGPVTGAALVAHPGVDVVAFTGGTTTGRAVGAAAGAGLKKLVTELGGKSANIVCADADLDRALQGALLAGYSANGQQCLAGSRLLVQRPVAERFLRELARRVAALKVGPPWDGDTEVGPLVSAAHRDRVAGYVAVAREEGAEILAGGAVLPGPGFYFSPTLALARDHAGRLCQEEIFGPFVTALVFDTPEEAMALANDTPFGLVAYVWTGGVATAMAAARDLRAGVVWVNTPMQRELRAPFGGFAHSGVGRAGGEWSRALYTEEKTITLPVRDFPLPPL